ATGGQLVAPEEWMGAGSYDGDLARYADDVAQRALALWQTDGVLDAVHVTPLGELPVAVVVTCPPSDALAHAWDLCASVGRPIEFAADRMPAVSAVVELTCTD